MYQVHFLTDPILSKLEDKVNTYLESVDETLVSVQITPINATLCATILTSVYLSPSTPAPEVSTPLSEPVLEESPSTLEFLG